MNNFSHIKEGYICPLCTAFAGEESSQTMIKQADIFYRDDLVIGFIGSKWIPGNEGHPLVSPIAHAEHVYEIPDGTLHRIAIIAKKIAIALKDVRACDGVTLVQNNEPAGDQHAFHYHQHVVPRFEGDQFHTEQWSTVTSVPEDRIKYAEALRTWFLSN